jgi:hypothetical protein
MIVKCLLTVAAKVLAMEKTIFLEILKRFEIVENKKSDGVTLHQKEKAWKDIAEEYNNSRDVLENVN